MSLGARILLGLIVLLVGALMVLIAPNDENRIGFYGIAAFTASASIFFLATGRFRDFFGSCVGLALFAAGLWYLVGQLDAGTLYSGSHGRPSIVNAILFNFLFGVPGILFAMKVRFGFRRSVAP